MDFDGTDWNIRRGDPNNKNYPPIKIFASKQSLALGRHLVALEDDPCTKGMEDKTVTITITHCNDEEFTCNDGNCVPMELRCNRISDCPDMSDERNCMLLIIAKGYIADYEPVTVDDNYNIVKVPVDVSVDVLKILLISEITGTFKVSFKLYLTWFDPRLRFKNIKEKSNLNKLTKFERDRVWKPVIVFDNTESKQITITDERTQATVRRSGNFTLSDITNNEETYFYEGDANPVTFTRIYDIPFLCTYDMAWYPFDIQICNMDLKPDGNTGEYIELTNQTFKYLGKEDLSVYFIRDYQYNKLSVNDISTVQGNYPFISTLLGMN